METKELIQKCDEWIKANQSSKVARALRKVSLNQLAREDCLPLARIARRSSQFKMGIRILKSLSQDETKTNQTLTKFERAELSVCLARLGAYTEALSIFETIDHEGDPDLCFAKLSVMFIQWKYKASQPIVEAMIQSEKSSDLQKLIGKVNLTAVHLFTRNLEQAEEVLRDSRKQAKALEHRLLYANSLEQSANLEILRADYSKAHFYIEKAKHAFGNSSDLYSLFLKKKPIS